jgi:hypothetical protein
MAARWLLLLASASAGLAAELPESARKLLSEYVVSRSAGDLYDLTGSDLVSAYVYRRLVREQGPERVSIQPFRRDLQLGSLDGAGAGTSLVALAGLTDLLSVAIETGAAVRKGDDKAMTFSFSGLPVYQLLSGRAPAGCGSADAECESGAGRWIRGIEGSVSLNLSQPVTAVPVGAGGGFVLGGRQVASWSVRYELLVREREEKRVKEALQKAAEALREPAAKFLKNQAVFETKLQSVLDAAGWGATTRALIQTAAARPGASAAELEPLLLERYRLAYSLAVSTQELREATALASKAKLEYLKVQNRELAEKLYRKALTVDYSQVRPGDQPVQHQIRVVAATPLGGKPGDVGESKAKIAPSASLTVNAGITLFDQTGRSITGGRVRDAQACLGIDWSPTSWGVIRPTYTAAYYFQYMLENAAMQFHREAVTPGGEGASAPRTAAAVANTRGPIHVAQLRVSIPLGASGVALPAAVSYASRAELLTGRRFWQGHIGVSYDLGNLRRLRAPARAP